jgi:hypothetical protein
MSQGVFGWRGKVTGLGLLLGVVLLSGATCIPDLSNTTSTTTPTAQTAPMTLTVDAPLANISVAAGTTVQISWTAFNGGRPGTITIFYDTDQNIANGVHNLTVVDLGAPNPPTRYNWNTTGLAAGTYYVGGTISDGTTTSAPAWAIGQVTITTTTLAKQYSLEELGTTIKGCVFEGFSPGGKLGTVMAGRFDMLSDQPAAAAPDRGVPDGISDFILVAPQADSHYIEDQGVGEAYLIFGWNSRTGSRGPGWYDGGHFNVNSVGTVAEMPGAIIVGPSYISSSLGITAVQPLADLDGDQGSELMFGTPLLINGRFEDQDYDPCDCNGGQYFNAPFAYPPFCINPPLPGIAPDDADWYAGVFGSGDTIKSSGYITVLASTTPGLYNPARKLGGVVHIDKIGETLDEPQPVVDRDIRQRAIDPALGLRVYPFARLARYYDFLNNDYRFGAALGTEDVDGDGVPDWLIAEPKANNGAGDITIGFSALALLWTSPKPAGSNSYSWPYMIPVGSCVPHCDRELRWPFGLIDYIRGDELKAPNGELSNPTGVGDFNGDGLGDIASSTPAYSAGGTMPDAGAAYIVFGRAPFGDHNVGEIKDRVIPNALPGIAIEGTAAGDRFGEQMTALGRPNYGMPGHPKLLDFNADGRIDWVISAPGRSIPGKANVGSVAIIWGNSRLDGRFNYDQIGTGDLPGIIITGANQGDRFGTWIAEAGDINGDGSDDLLVAAPGAENPITGLQDTGAVYIIYGPPLSGAEHNAYQALSGTYSIQDLLNNGGPIKVRVIYGSVAGHGIGPVAGAGDIDNDGYEDILIADPLAAPLGQTDAGAVYLVFGGKY